MLLANRRPKLDQKGYKARRHHACAGSGLWCDGAGLSFRHAGL